MRSYGFSVWGVRVESLAARALGTKEWKRQINNCNGDYNMQSQVKNATELG